MAAESEAMVQARQLFRAGELHSAMEAAQVAAERAPRSADAWWLLGRVTRHVGLLHASDQAFRRAAQLSRKRPAPVRLTAAEFAEVLEAARAELSPDARRRLSATEILVSPLPPPAAVREGIDPDAVSRRERSPVDTLTLYQANLENRCPDVAGLRALVVRTLSRA